jgi:hypothetical protein
MGNRDDVPGRSARSGYNRQSAMRNGSNGPFTVRGINRQSRFLDSRRGGYQGPSTRGQIAGQLGRAGGGWVGGRSAAQQSGWRSGFR